MSRALALAGLKPLGYAELFRADPPSALPFELRVVYVAGEPKIRVYASTLAGGSSADLGFSEGDDPPYLLTPAEGVLQGAITLDSTGEVSSRSLEIVSTLGTSGGSDWYVEIGTISQDEDDVWHVSNSRYGPIPISVCGGWDDVYAVTFL